MSRYKRKILIFLIFRILEHFSKLQNDRKFIFQIVKPEVLVNRHKEKYSKKKKI